MAMLLAFVVVAIVIGITVGMFMGSSRDQTARQAALGTRELIHTAYTLTAGENDYPVGNQAPISLNSRLIDAGAVPEGFVGQPDNSITFHYGTIGIQSKRLVQATLSSGARLTVGPVVAALVVSNSNGCFNYLHKLATGAVVFRAGKPDKAIYKSAPPSAISALCGGVGASHPATFIAAVLRG
jgi:type II secretory pathway pseudopilin PulG